LRACVEALKSSVESLAGQRGDAANRAVTFRDLVSFGVISPAALQSSSGAGNAVGGIIGNYLPLTGGTLSGPLVLAADPIAPLEAVTKQYADSHYLLLTGGTLTGLLTLSGPPTAALHAATKAYVDGHAPLGGPYLPLTGGTITGGVYAPTPATGDNSTQIATTAFVKAQGYVGGGPYLPIAGGTVTSNLTVSGAMAANNWFSTGLNTPAYPAGTAAFAISWNHTQGAGETDFWNTYQSAGGFNSFHFWQMTGASTAIDIMQVGPSGLQLSGSLVTTGAQSGWNMNDRLAGQTPSGWVIYPSGGKLSIYNNFNSDAYYFYYSAFVPVHDNANWCGQAGTAWYACQSYAYNTSSDMRHKTDIEDLPGCLDFVRRLAPKRFKFNNAPPEDRQRSHWGFIAQEVGAAFRETDFGGHRADPAGESISYNELTAVLWKVCQELLARVEQLEAA
jgi:hypothetical protein